MVTIKIDVNEKEVGEVLAAIHPFDIHNLTVTDKDGNTTTLLKD